MKRYEVSPSIGWGNRGPFYSGIRREAHILNLGLEPLPWAKISDLCVPIKVVVTGDEEAVDKFRAYAVMMGYEGREYPSGITEVNP